MSEEDERYVPTYTARSGWRSSWDVVREGLVSNRVIGTYQTQSIAQDVAAFLSEAAEDEDT